jgi:D-tyrosyl-tRNA(Tyr) deacylase
MRVVVQRVSRASVSVEGAITGEIGAGLLVLFGVKKEDSLSSIDWLVNKVIDLRIFSDAQGKMNLSLRDTGGELLVVSQFTLYGNCINGRRPDFTQAADPQFAEN